MHRLTESLALHSEKVEVFPSGPPIGAMRWHPAAPVSSLTPACSRALGERLTGCRSFGEHGTPG